MLCTSNIRTGDVLLCYKDSKMSPSGKAITYVTGSNYTHAAICISPNLLAEATLFGGVSKVTLEEFINRYDHVAVFRQPYAWQSQKNIQLMNDFVNSIIDSKAKYNLRGVAVFKYKSEAHKVSVIQKLNDFFNGAASPEPIIKRNYFCSELVVSCFSATNFISPSAQVLYRSSVTSPGDLGREPTFGIFCGYISKIPGYSVPSTDEFFNVSTFDEIYPNGLP